jgi:MFS family permease
VSPTSALAYANFRVYFVGLLVSATGGWMLRMSQSWLVLELGGSPFLVGLVAVFQSLPVTFLTLFAGVLLDRVDMRKVIIMVCVGLLLQAGALAALMLLGAVQMWQVFALALVLGTISAFETPARAAFIGQLVGARALANAIGLNSTVQNGARIIGPALAGLVIGQWGVGLAFALAAVCNLVATVSMFLLDRAELLPARRARRGAVLGLLADGLRYAARTPVLLAPLLLLAFIGTFGYNFSVFLPLLAHDAFAGGSEAFGLMNAAMGVGSVVGALAIVARVAPRQGMLLLAGAGFCGLLMVVALTPWFPLVLVPLTLLGVVSVVYSATTNTLLQIHTREDYRGRVLSLYTFLFIGTTPVGGLVTGALADAWNVRLAMVVQALICLVGVATALAYSRAAPAARPAVAEAPAPR